LKVQYLYLTNYAYCSRMIFSKCKLMMSDPTYHHVWPVFDASSTSSFTNLCLPPRQPHNFSQT
jgi:hypothetical protein